MHYPLRRGLAALLFVSAFFTSPPSVHAQNISSGEIERAFSPGAYVPNDGMPFSHRYNYYSGPALYFNGSSRQLWMQDYLDRVDRAARFGYCPPAPPRYLTRPQCTPSTQVGVGVIIWR